MKILKNPNFKAQELSLSETVEALKNTLAWGEKHFTGLERGIIFKILHELEGRRIVAQTQEFIKDQQTSMKKLNEKTKGRTEEPEEEIHESQGPSHWERLESEYMMEDL